ncbi:MAG: hypothetical protein HN936_15275 [Bacteroidetes bacterium]|jgi:hypothetical protein|nr:hypothetical protein [Bacteroidota bacterium]MBT4397955.1 hypothetical protein [Bacteroidota bacterium]MBT4408883.1 hypothetical protein [Bacteroidota bacterium]MBT5427946.1 hypothetical protein [Bacteroidota bacterium]MBT7094608.1 hypothetical protein [Bacteroidota bacterium]
MFYTLLKIQRFFEALYQTCISLMRILFRFRFRNQVPRSKSKSSHLLILANGPSLNDSLHSHPEEFIGKQLMAVNQFVLSDQYARLKPSHYVLLDIGFFMDKTIPRVLDIRNNLIASFIEKTAWPLTLYFPREGKGSAMHRALVESGKAFEFVFFNRTNVEGLRGFRHWAYRNNLGMPKPQNVLVGCLILALVMRIETIEIYGADHTWLENIRIDDENRLISVEKHFYDKDKKGIPTLREHPELLTQSKLHEYIFDLARTFSSYHLIRDFADSIGSRIINASKVTYIDAFERRK